MTDTLKNNCRNVIYSTPIVCLHDELLTSLLEIACGLLEGLEHNLLGDGVAEAIRAQQQNVLRFEGYG